MHPERLRNIFYAYSLVSLLYKIAEFPWTMRFCPGETQEKQKTLFPSSHGGDRSVTIDRNIRLSVCVPSSVSDPRMIRLIRSIDRRLRSNEPSTHSIIASRLHACLTFSYIITRYIFIARAAPRLTVLVARPREKSDLAQPSAVSASTSRDRCPRHGFHELAGFPARAMISARFGGNELLLSGGRVGNAGERDAPWRFQVRPLRATRIPVSAIDLTERTLGAKFEGSLLLLLPLLLSLLFPLLSPSQPRAVSITECIEQVCHARARAWG